jgi:hypothetical protein
MPTAVLLGAGASFSSDFKLPLMDSFFSDSTTPLQEELRDFLQAFYRSDDAANYNLEEVLAYLELSRSRAPLWGYAPEPEVRTPERLYLAVLDFMRQRLAIPDHQGCTLHQALLSWLKPPDTVITLNYDLIIENTALNLLGKRRGYASDPLDRLDKVVSLIGNDQFVGGTVPGLLPRERESGFYLKLHGSLDWLYCPTLGCPNHIRLFATRLSALGEGQEPDQPCRLCGALLRMFVVPPVATKRIDDTGRLALLWNLALRAIRDADRVVIAGVSVTATDFELKWLLRAATLARRSKPHTVCVVNPSREARKRTVALLRHPGATFTSFASIRDLLEDRPLAGAANDTERALVQD